ncbi:MAG: CDP-alcohol phosphatidyltransferase family protein [Candidatus Neomarinimicrobiota bacterium]|nr:MAG: CDP-alcohol phosphatidyltransferase family protein [Candidatus Neomarinimicrobiota bacterium]
MSQTEKRKITDPTRILTVANMISLFRAVMAVPIVYAMANQAPWSVIFSLIVAAVLSDALDGYFARKAHEVTHVGKWLDPIADFIVVSTVVFHMVLNHLFPLWFFLFYLIRILTIALLSVYIINHSSLVVSANRTGKWFIGLTALTVAIHIFPLPQFTLIRWPLFFLTTVLGLISWAQYVSFLLREFKRLN